MPIKDPIKRAEWNRAYKAGFTRERKRAAILRTHGMTPAEYNALLAAQRGVCAICGRPPTKRPLFVDHHHKSGKNRGLLCFKCNALIGLAKECTGRLSRAIDYLARYV